MLIHRERGRSTITKVAKTVELTTIHRMKKKACAILKNFLEFLVFMAQVGYFMRSIQNPPYLWQIGSVAGLFKNQIDNKTESDSS